MQGNVISSEYTINEYLHNACRQNLKPMYLYNKKCQLVMKLSIVIELKESVTENFIQRWFCRTFHSVLLMLFLQISLFVVVQFMLDCWGAYMTCFKSLLLKNVTDNPGHIF